MSDAPKAKTSYKVQKSDLIFQRDDFRVRHCILDRGEEIPRHLHSRVTDTFYVIRGELALQTGDPPETITLREGQTHAIPPQVPHVTQNPSEAPVEFLILQGIGVYDFVNV